MKNFLDKFLSWPWYFHLLLAVVLTAILLIGTLRWLQVYTRHNVAIVVPDVKGLKLDKAEGFLRKSGLRYNVIDSVYSKDVVPGAIVETSPAAGSKVKEGRIIFVTINAETSQMSSVPEVADLSLRQAYALLKAKGFETITTEYIEGEYKDLVIGVELNGRRLEPDQMVPLTSPLVLIVSSGLMEEIEPESDFSEWSTEPTEPTRPVQPTRPAEPVESEDENWF